MSKNICICIPTYKRPELLKKLISDLRRQRLAATAIIIIDGFPASDDVLQMLLQIDSPNPWRVVYVPSNHANLAYQRYLGWRAAVGLSAEVIVYFDDDLRIYQNDVLDRVVQPLVDNNNYADNVVGVGSFIRFPESNPNPAMAHMHKVQPNWLVRTFGSRARLKLEPGQISPTGHRVAVTDNGQDYVTVDWLRGGTMAYRMSAIAYETFSEDLFALTHIHCGLGEDTFLSRRVGARGKLLYTFRAVVDHPHADTPKAYPYEAYKFAYAATYSRRFLNDHYRVYAAPTAVDRWALVKSYLGNTLLAWMEVARKPTKTNFALARGTTLGAFHGLTRPATAKRLTPDVDWWGDAEKALSGAITVRHGELTPDS